MAERSDPQDVADEGRPAVDLTTVLLAIARSRWWIVGAVGLGGLAGLIAGARELNTYTSEAKLQLLVGERESLKPEAFVSIDSRSMPSAQSLPTVTDEIYMLYDLAVYEQAAKRIGPERILVPPDPTATDDSDTPLGARAMHLLQSKIADRGYTFDDYESPGAVLAAARTLSKDTRINAGPNSHVLFVEHTSTTPTRAKEFTVVLLEAFIERHKAQYSILPFLAEHADEIAAARQDRDTATQAYADHMTQCGFVALETQGPAMITERSTTEEDLFDARSELEGIQVELAQLTLRLEGIPPQIDEVVPAVTGSNLEYETQYTLLRDLQAGKQLLRVQDLPLEQLRRREKEYDEGIVRARELLKGLESTEVRVPEQRTPVPNPEHVALKTRVDDLSVRQMVLERRVAQLEARLGEIELMLEQVRVCEQEHAELLAVRDEKKTRFDELFEHYSKLEALGNIDVDGEANLRVLAAPTFNPDKVGPDRAKLLAMGLFGGAALGLFLALARLLLDPRVRYPQTVAGAFGRRVLGVVPHERGLRGLASRSSAAPPELWLEV